jgi:large subunit ribosomal protein L21
MYAIIKSGGRQHRVSEGESLRVELLHAEVGSNITLSEVLLVGSGESVKLGRPLVAGASVTASVVRHARAKKVLVFKKKRRKGFHKKIGHRQFFTELKITGISG